MLLARRGLRMNRDDEEDELDYEGISSRDCFHTTHYWACVGSLKVIQDIVSTRRPVKQGNDPRLVHSSREPSQQPSTLQKSHLQ